MGRGGSRATPCVANGVSQCKVRSFDSVQAGSVEDLLLPAVSYKELQLHSTAEDCWIVISGKVYNVTKWLAKHPGGAQSIVNVAGQDATDVFTMFHPPRVLTLLPKYFVGDLEEVKVSETALDYRKMVQQVEEEGLFKTNYWNYYLLAMILVPLLGLVVAGVVFSKNFLVHMACAALLGEIWNQCNFVGHDAGHNGITKNRKIDSLIGLFVGNMMTGIGIGWWKSTHNVHHVVCNSLEYDPDIQHVPVYAISSKFFSSLYSQFHKREMTFDSVARAFVSIQHFTYYPIMAVARVNLYIQSILLVLSGDKMQSRALELAGLAFFWTWHISLLLALPSWGTRVCFFLLCHAVAGILHVQICISHWPMPTFEGRQEDNAFFETQLQGTLDVECHPWLDWFHGGLQFQIEHHVFPRLPRHNLRKVKQIVMTFCKQHEIAYHSVDFFEAQRMVLRTLKAAAMEARDLSKPAPKLSKTLIWDAMNAKG